MQITKVHVWVGGEMGAPSSAANDPVFWLHHCNVDRLWDVWQQANPEVANSYIGTFSMEGQAPRAASVDDPLSMSIDTVQAFYGTHPVSDMFKITDWCYSYSVCMSITISTLSLLRTMIPACLRSTDPL